MTPLSFSQNVDPLPFLPKFYPHTISWKFCTFFALFRHILDIFYTISSFLKNFTPLPFLETFVDPPTTFDDPLPIFHPPTTVVAPLSLSMTPYHFPEFWPLLPLSMTRLPLSMTPYNFPDFDPYHFFTPLPFLFWPPTPISKILTPLSFWKCPKFEMHSILNIFNIKHMYFLVIVGGLRFFCKGV